MRSELNSEEDETAESLDLLRATRVILYMCEM